MDEEIVLLVYQINDLLSFVEDTRFLTEKLNSFHAIIVDALHTIKKCCASIRDYLKASLPGMSKVNCSFSLLFIDFLVAIR